jgi:hypothetical protein
MRPIESQRPIPGLALDRWASWLLAAAGGQNHARHGPIPELDMAVLSVSQRVNAIGLSIVYRGWHAEEAEGRHAANKAGAACTALPPPSRLRSAYKDASRLGSLIGGGVIGRSDGGRRQWYLCDAGDSHNNQISSGLWFFCAPGLESGVESLSALGGLSPFRSAAHQNARFYTHFYFPGRLRTVPLSCLQSPVFSALSSGSRCYCRTSSFCAPCPRLI